LARSFLSAEYPAVAYVVSISLRKSFKEGFTLVELMVVIAIIGILATMLLLQLGTARAKARDAKRIADINQIRTAIEMFYDDNSGRYPTDIVTITAGDGLSLTGYMTSGALPLDPVSGGPYGYAASGRAIGSPIRFHLYTELERMNAPAFAARAKINSTDQTKWPSGATTYGQTLDASPANLCTVTYIPPSKTTGALDATSKDCVYDVGQN